MPEPLNSSRSDVLINAEEFVLPGPASTPYLERQAQRESNARTYPRRIPIVIRRARGIFVEDQDGRQFFDCLAGAGTVTLGHNHPVVVEAIRSALDQEFPLHTLDLLTSIKDEFVQELFDNLPQEFARHARIQFCSPAGEDATEAALKLVKTATGNRTLFAFHGGYHGMSHGALSLTGNLNAKLSVPGLMPDVHFLPYPYDFRCPFGMGGENGHRTGSYFIESVIDDPESGIVPAAGMILEVVQGEGGVIPAPDAWLREIRRITQEHNIPLIVDEIQSGFGRTGKMFAFQHSGIVPDVLLLSKAIGGSLPLAVVLYHERLDTWQPGAHAGTFRGNVLAMAAGLATIRFIREQGLVEHAAQMGERLMGHLRSLQGDASCIGDVRGRGLMVGVEIVDTNGKANHRGIYPQDTAMARRIQAESLKRGLILELGGRFGSVVRFLPPLIITPEQVDDVCAIFSSAVKAAATA